MRAVKGSLTTPLWSSESEGRLFVSVLISLPNCLIFGLGSVYRAPKMRETLDMKRTMRLTG